MHLVYDEKYQLKISLNEFLTQSQIFECEREIESNLDFLGIAKCHIYGKALEIIFNPPEEITDEYIFNTINQILMNIGLSFTKAVIRQFVGNAARTLTASATGGALGARGGILGAIVGAVLGAAVEKAIFDWKSICECECDEFGSLIIHRHGDE